jgi:hypothetical protein
MLDGRYLIKVVRKEPYKGTLEIWEKGTLLFEQNVGIAYDAPFGPDESDVAEWQDVAMKFIDKRGADGDHRA